MTLPPQRRKMAGTAVARRGVSIALARRTFGVSETCYCYGPKLSDENEQIADVLVGLDLDPRIDSQNSNWRRFRYGCSNRLDHPMRGER